MKLKSILILALALLFSNAFAQKNKAVQPVAGQLAGYYLNLKNSLIISDKDNAAKGADSLLSAITSLPKKSRKEYSSSLDSLSKYAGQIAGTTNINFQRKSFSSLSRSYWPIVEKSVLNQPLYLQVCPMTGEKWISKEKEIRNPYYPKNMLTCGEVQGQSAESK